MIISHGDAKTQRYYNKILVALVALWEKQIWMNGL
jgi:hypothetical protein